TSVADQDPSRAGGLPEEAVTRHHPHRADSLRASQRGLELGPVGQLRGVNGLTVGEHLVPALYGRDGGGHEKTGVGGEGKEPVVSDGTQPQVAVVFWGVL